MRSTTSWSATCVTSRATRSAYEAYKAEQNRSRSGNSASGRVADGGGDSQGEYAQSFPTATWRTLRNATGSFARATGAARQKYSIYLCMHDPDLWRLLMPCDPVITVAPDCLFFECFSADESSYGCLTVGREAFEAERDVALGTTNVDYSWALYEHFQKLRSYRETRFAIDPSGFEVNIERGEGFREEKIDLPPSWLRGFMQIQGAMSLPMRRVPISREGLYSMLAFLRRHRAAKSPRAVRFELERGRPVSIVLEPWEERITLHGTAYDGPRDETIRVWGRDRLHVLARLLPLLDEAEVYLLGTGLPSFWSIRMGEMRLLLGLSGWTANDWTGATALDQLAPPAEPSDALLGDIAATFLGRPALTFNQIRERTGAAPAFVAAGLCRLASLGQVVHDLHAGLYRWRQVMPVAVSLEQIGPESPETDGRLASSSRGARCGSSRDEKRPDGLRILEGESGGRAVSLLLDADGRMLRGRCTCSHHFTGGLRRGPCRHLQALRLGASGTKKASSLESWFQIVSSLMRVGMGWFQRVVRWLTGGFAPERAFDARSASIGRRGPGARG